jgi:hypothetical protein
VLLIEETDYDHDLTINDILPYYRWNMTLTEKANSEVVCNRLRTVCQDTVYNSVDDARFKIENQNLIPFKSNVQYEYNTEHDWVTMNVGGGVIKREFYFYVDKEPEETQNFNFNKNVLSQLDSMIHVLPAKAWGNHTKKHNEISNKTKIYNEGTYGKEIELNEAKTIEAFTPVLWYLVSLDSGFIAGIKGTCVVVGYNTPLSDADGLNKRCLAIYERVGSVYQLRKQSLNALQMFGDYNEDFSYHDFNEANFSVGITEGGVSVSYQYMTGEANDLFAFQNGDWFLIAYESSGRSYIRSESTSYDYRTKMYKFSSYSISEDEEERDSTSSIYQVRPPVYMDSTNVMQYDY